MSQDPAAHAQVHVRLYIAGVSPNSMMAQDNLKAIVAERNDVPIDFEIVDVLGHPELAAEDHVLVTPMLVRIAPSPRLRIVGNLHDRDAAMRILGLEDHHGE